MKIVINPYIGYSDNLADSVTKFGGTLEKPKCPDGLCPIQVPVKLMTKKKINELVQTQAKQANVDPCDEVAAAKRSGPASMVPPFAPFDLIIVSLTEKDQLTLVKMSRTEGWGSLKGVNVKIVCNVGVDSTR